MSLLCSTVCLTGSENDFDQLQKKYLTNFDVIFNVFCARISSFFTAYTLSFEEDTFRRVDVDNRNCQKCVSRNTEVVFSSYFLLVLPFDIDPFMNSNLSL